MSRFFSFFKIVFLVFGGLVFSVFFYFFCVSFYYHPILIAASESRIYQVRLEWKSGESTKVIDTSTVNTKLLRKQIKGLFLSGQPHWVVVSEGKETRIHCERLSGPWRRVHFALKIEEDITKSKCHQIQRG